MSRTYIESDSLNTGFASVIKSLIWRGQQVGNKTILGRVTHGQEWIDGF